MQIIFSAQNLFITCLLAFASEYGSGQTGLDSPQTSSPKSTNENQKETVFTPDYRIYETLLAKYVDPNGAVNIKDLKSDKDFQTVLESIKLFQPDGNWSREQTMCFWINMYNIHVLKMLCDNYGLKSISEIDRPWETVAFKLGLKHGYTLNQVREILRKKFNDPRIHFALFMGNVSSPALLAKPYRPETVNNQLNQQTKAFISDPAFNTITPNAMVLSKLFELYKADFTASVGLNEWINRHSDTKATDRASVTFHPFDWTIVKIK